MNLIETPNRNFNICLISAKPSIRNHKLINVCLSKWSCHSFHSFDITYFGIYDERSANHIQLPNEMRNILGWNPHSVPVLFKLVLTWPKPFGNVWLKFSHWLEATSNEETMGVRWCVEKFSKPNSNVVWMTKSNKCFESNWSTWFQWKSKANSQVSNW